MSRLGDWSANASAHEFWFVSGILALFALAGLVALIIGHRRARMILDIPTARVRSAAQGYVELQGTARWNADEPMVGPLTSQPCVWYEYKVERKRRSGKKTSWHTVRKGRSEESFLIDDGTGRCVVFPEGAAVTPEAQDVWYGERERPDRPPSAGGRGASAGGFSFEVAGVSLGGRRYRYTEKRIHDGDPLYGIGWFETVNPGDEVTLAQETRAAIAEIKADRKALLERFDSDRDGEIDLAEWEAARAVVQREVVAARAERSAGATAVHTLMKPPQRGQPYLLSTKSEDHLVRHYRTMVWVGGAFFVIFSGIVAWLASGRF